MRIVFSCIVAFIFTFILKSCNEHDENSKKTNIYHQEAKVISTGQCDGNSCSLGVRAEGSSEVEYIMLNSPVSVGQTVYKMCWFEKARGNMCYVKYSTVKETS